MIQARGKKRIIFDEEGSHQLDRVYNKKIKYQLRNFKRTASRKKDAGKLPRGRSI